MKKNFFISAMMLVLAVACEKNEDFAPKEAREMVELEVSVPQYATKSDGESVVADCQVMVYSLETGLLEAYSKTGGIDSPITIQCTVGQKEVVVLCNAPDMRSKVKLSDLKAARSLLSHNSVGALVMEGSKVVQLTASSSETVNVRRVVSKIRFKSIVTRFEQEGYKDLDFKLKSVYLINVPADKLYLATSSLSLGVLPGAWYCQDEFSDNIDGCGPFLFHDLSSKKLEPDVEYEMGQVFYCCPNPYVSESYTDPWQPRPTRLVVEAYIGTEQCCYPITLPELKQNAVYDVSLVVTRPGKKDPSSDMEQYEETFTIEVVGWETGGSQSEIL